MDVVVLLLGDGFLCQEGFVALLFAACPFQCRLHFSHRSLGLTDVPAAGLHTLAGLSCSAPHLFESGFGLCQFVAVFCVVDDDERVALFHLSIRVEAHTVYEALHLNTLRHHVAADACIAGCDYAAMAQKFASHYPYAGHEQDSDDEAVAPFLDVLFVHLVVGCSVFLHRFQIVPAMKR